VQLWAAIDPATSESAVKHAEWPSTLGASFVPALERPSRHGGSSGQASVCGSGDVFGDRFGQPHTYEPCQAAPSAAQIVGSADAIKPRSVS
jgi:hypothetical protein